MALPQPTDIEQAVKVFGQRDTAEQATIIRRVGEGTALADTLLGHLAGMYPDRYNALLALTGWARA